MGQENRDLFPIANGQTSLDLDQGISKILLYYLIEVFPIEIEEMKANDYLANRII